jgi:hypothetical protein
MEHSGLIAQKWKTHYTGSELRTVVFIVALTYRERSPDEGT